MPKHYKKIDASSLHYLKASHMHPANTYFHFSFANYYNPKNTNFGVLRVLNDDDVKPQNGFGEHPHKDIEIISYIVKGELTHWDNTSDVEKTLKRGNVQILTAGNGIWHSELNKHAGWTRFLQIWIMPPTKNLPVRYENHTYTKQQRDNNLLHIVGNPSNKAQVPLYLNQDVNLYASELSDATKKVSFSLQKGRQAYINNIEGNVAVKDIATLEERDSLEIIGPAEIEFSLAGKSAHFIIIEMAESRK